MRIEPLATTLAATLASILVATEPAHAGWHAVQTEEAADPEAKAPKQSLESDIYFEGSKMRVDQGRFGSVIYDFTAGRLTVLNHGQKTFMVRTLDEMAKARTAMDAQRKKQMANLPPEVQKQLEAKLEGAESGKTSKPTPTGKTDKVGKFSCAIYTWSSERGTGEMCVAKDVGVNLKPFVAMTEKFSKRLEEAVGASESDNSLVEIARLGFPVRSMRKVTFGKRTMQTTTTLVRIEAMRVAADKFEVPVGYSKSAFPTGPGIR